MSTLDMIQALKRRQQAAAAAVAAARAAAAEKAASAPPPPPPEPAPARPRKAAAASTPTARRQPAVYGSRLLTKPTVENAQQKKQKTAHQLLSGEELRAARSRALASAPLEALSPLPKTMRALAPIAAPGAVAEYVAALEAARAEPTPEPPPAAAAPESEAERATHRRVADVVARSADAARRAQRRVVPPTTPPRTVLEAPRVEVDVAATAAEIAADDDVNALLKKSPANASAELRLAAEREAARRAAAAEADDEPEAAGADDADVDDAAARDLREAYELTVDHPFNAAARNAAIRRLNAATLNNSEAALGVTQLQRELLTTLDFVYYADLLRMPVATARGLFGGANGLRGTTRACTPIARRDDDAYLRTPRANERHCVFDNECEGMRNPHFPHRARLVERVPPRVLAEHLESPRAATSPWPETQYPCLMCTRKQVGALFTYLRALMRPVDPSISLSYSYCHVNVVGEYDEHACYCDARYGLFRPQVMHVRPWYTQRRADDGTWHYEQTGYARVEPPVVGGTGPARPFFGPGSA